MRPDAAARPEPRTDRGAETGGDGAVSLRRQLLLWLLVPLLALFVGGSFASYWVAIKFANRAYDVGLYDSARSIAKQVRTAGGLATLSLPREALEILASDPYDKVWFKVERPDGRIVAGDAALPSAASECGVPERVAYFDGRIGDEDVRVACYPASVEAGSAPFVVYAAETLIKRERLASQILLAVLLPQLALIVIAGFVVWLGIGRGLTPLDRLSDALRRRDHRDLSRVAEYGAPREVIPLTHAINDLLARLEAALSAQRRFVADAAHQIRTPLAGLMAQTERVLRSSDPTASRAALEQLETSARRSVRLANQLLSLARAEPDPGGEGRVERIDVAALAREVCGEWVPHAIAAGADLGYEGPDAPVIVDGDRTLIGELVGNLVDNALRYGQRGVVVTVRVGDDPTPWLAVEDDGPGIPESERGPVLRRFYRIPGSPVGGCGLGLAIVAEVAARHGATLDIGTAGGGSGTRVRVVFPRPAAADIAASGR